MSLSTGGIYAILYSPFMGCHANALYSLFVHGRRLPVRALYIVSFVPKLPKLLIKTPWPLHVTATHYGSALNGPCEVFALSRVAYGAGIFGTLGF